MNFKDSKDANTYMEELIVHHQFGDKVGVTLGRQDLTLGQTGTTMMMNLMASSRPLAAINLLLIWAMAVSSPGI